MAKLLADLELARAVAACDRLTEQLRLLPDEQCRSLTWDRGMDLAAHERATKGVGLPVYFADPHTPWQRDTTENTNGLLRRYFPKKITMHPFSQSDLDAIAHRLNTDPGNASATKRPQVG